MFCQLSWAPVLPGVAAVILSNCHHVPGRDLLSRGRPQPCAEGSMAPSSANVSRLRSRRCQCDCLSRCMHLPSGAKQPWLMLGCCMSGRSGTGWSGKPKRRSGLPRRPSALGSGTIRRYIHPLTALTACFLGVGTVILLHFFCCVRPRAVSRADSLCSLTCCLSNWEMCRSCRWPAAFPRGVACSRPGCLGWKVSFSLRHNLKCLTCVQPDVSHGSTNAEAERRESSISPSSLLVLRCEG